MPEKYQGNYQSLQDHVLLTGDNGEWRELDNNLKQYRTEDGAVLNWWASTKTIMFQGRKEEANAFKAKFDAVRHIGVV